VSEIDRKDREEPIDRLVQDATSSILRLPRKLAKQVAQTVEIYQRQGEGVTVAAGRHRLKMKENIQS